MSEEDLINIGWIAFLILAGVGLFKFNFYIADRRLQSWARMKGVTIVSKQICWIRRGPFTFRATGNRLVYRICVRYPNGDERFSWAACSTTFLWDRRPVLIQEDAPGFPVIMDGQ